MVRLSIVIPFYNTGRKAIDLINSLNDQITVYSNEVEVLFINDGSTDDTVSFINNSLSLCNFKIYNKSNGGVSSARNYGLDLAKGDYVIFVDSDDYFLPSAVSTIFNHINFDLGSDIFAFNYAEVVAGNVSINIDERAYDSLMFSCKYISGSMGHIISVTSCVFRRSFLKEKNIRFNEIYAYAEDQDFLLRVSLRGNIKHIAKYVIGYNKDLSTAMNSVTLKRFDAIEVFLSWKKLPGVESSFVDKRITSELIYIGRSHYKSLSFKESVLFFNDKILDQYCEHLSHNFESLLFFKFPRVYIFLYKLQRNLRTWIHRISAALWISR